MTGYRLMFNTSDPTVETMADAVGLADYTLGQAAGTLAAHATILRQDFYVMTYVTQFTFRFEAADDEAAYAAAVATLDSVSAPTDSISLARRSRSYVPVEVSP